MSWSISLSQEVGNGETAWLGKDPELKAMRLIWDWVTMITDHMPKYREARAGGEHEVTHRASV